MSTLKEQIAFIGIGQCGGNIAVQAERVGFPTGVINTSEEDISSESMRIITNKLIVGDTDGCGKDRTIGQSIVKKEWETILNWIKTNFIEKIDGLKIIYLCFSTSGGTGSGIGPILLNLLQRRLNNEENSICYSAIAVLPSLDESPVALYNCKQCLKELNRLELPLLIPDNDNSTNKSSRKNLYDNINSNIIKGISTLIEDRESTGVADMDKKDKLKLLTTNGVTMISVSPLVENEIKDENTLAGAINSSLSKSVYTTANFDGIVKRIGFIFEIPEMYSKNINYSLITKNIGRSNEIFEGIYNKELRQIYSFTMILSGLSFPEYKITKINEKLKDDNETNKKLLENKTSIFDEFDDEVDDFKDLFKEDTKKRKVKKISSFEGDSLGSDSLEDIFDNYN